MSTNASIEPSAREQPIVTAPGAPQPEHAAYTNSTFSSHPQPAAEGPASNRAPAGPAGQPLPHGYGHQQISQTEAHIHPELRSPQEAPTTAPAYVPIPNMLPPGMQSLDQTVTMTGPPAPVAAPMAAADAGENATDRRKAKRELSQSKRAAQNRAAQRAFRQRKEEYIRNLERQVAEFTQSGSSLKELQEENYKLKEYISHLQSVLHSSLGEYPPPPPGLNLSDSKPQQAHSQQQHPPRGAVPANTMPHPPAGTPGPHHPAGPAPAGPTATTTTTTTTTAPNPLEVAAQAVAGLTRSSEQLAAAAAAASATGRDPYAATAGVRDDDARTAEEITRQLQQADEVAVDGLSGP
ncbi:hypothetical protein VTK26DRAFT_533 [Humicola hyalothermophila]